MIGTDMSVEQLHTLADHQRGEIERLEKELAKWKGRAGAAGDVGQMLKDRAEAAEASLTAARRETWLAAAEYMAANERAAEAHFMKIVSETPNADPAQIAMFDEICQGVMICFQEMAAHFRAKATEDTAT